jgi:hypothetical protein
VAIKGHAMFNNGAQGADPGLGTRSVSCDSPRREDSAQRFAAENIPPTTDSAWGLLSVGGRES